MTPAITLTFGTLADLNTWLDAECAKRIERTAITTSEADQLGRDVSLLADSIDAINNRLKQMEILGAKHIQAIQRLESTAAKVVETNQGLHQRVKALEEDGVTEWDGQLPEPGEKEAA